MSTQGSTVAIIQARMGSTRLCGKSLMELAGKPVLQWVIERVGRAKTLDAIWVATSTASSDDCLAGWCARSRVLCFRGSENDVLGRFVAAADACDASWIVRVNGDNPLIDASYVDQLVSDGVQNCVDYASYQRADGTPVMLTALSFFAEVMSRACLRRADRDITDPFEREHVTLGVYRRPQAYRVQWLEVPAFCEERRLRFTLDTAGDLELLERIAGALGDEPVTATAEAVVRLVHKHPEWLQAMEELNRSNQKPSLASES